MRRAARCTTLLAIAALAAAACTGCYNTWPLSPGDLRVLRGYRAPRTVTFTSTLGDKVSFNSDTWVTFSSPDGYQRYRFAAITAVDDSSLAGVVTDSWLTGSSPGGYRSYRLAPTRGLSGREPKCAVTVDLRTVSIEANQLSGSRTALAIVLPIVLGTGLVILMATTRWGEL